MAKVVVGSLDTGFIRAATRWLSIDYDQRRPISQSSSQPVSASGLHRQGFPPCPQPSCPMALSVCHSHTQPLPLHTQHGLVSRVRKSLGAAGFFIMVRVITRDGCQ